MSFGGNKNLTAVERSRRNDLLRGLLARLDDHAPGEWAHAERVAVYSVATGKELGLDESELLMLRYAAELHDIGKLEIDPDLLMSGQPLEPHERVIVERHVVLAKGVLPDEEFLAPVISVIRHHHERWAGGGYPDNLRDDEIPIGSRIIGAAETLDVMLEGATWRKPFPEDVARSALQGLSGSWFEPAVVEALLRIQPLVQPLKV
jgi:HD-GYP domain-containing protein (c-di-GMP phosphodiesterase class II)